MNKTEKENISIDIFVSDITSITRISHLPGIEKKHLSYNTLKMLSFHTSKIEGPILFLWIRDICVANENQGLRQK